MEVIFEIEDNMLKVAAGVIALKGPSKYDEIMKYAESISKKGIVIGKDKLNELSTIDKSYEQLPVLIAMVAIGLSAMNKDEDEIKEK